MTHSRIRDQFPEAYGRWVVRWRWPVLLVSLLIFAGSIVGATRIVISADNDVFFDEDNPQLLALEQFEETYIKEEGILFVIAPDDKNVFSRETLAAIEWLTNECWQIPYCVRVDSLTNYQNTYAEEDDIVVESLVVNAPDLTDADLIRIREVALSEPLMVGRSLSPEGHVATIYAVMELPGLNQDERVESLSMMNELVAELKENFPGIQVYLNGGAVTAQKFNDFTNRDMATLVPLMYLVILLLIPLALRSVVASIAASTMILLSVGTAFGLTGWSGMLFTAPSAAMPHMVMSLAVADCIHILVVLLNEMRRGKEKHEAIVESIRVSLGPVFLTSFTTAIGLLSMNFSPVPPIRDFGNSVTLGVMAAFFFSVGYLPALVAILPMRVKAKTSTTQGVAHNPLGRFVVNNRSMLLVAGALMTIGLALMVPRNEFKNNWTKWFDESTEFRQDLKFIRENLSGANTMEFSLGAGESSGISNPEYLAKLDEFANWIRTQPSVDHVMSYTDIIKRLNKNMHNDDDAYYRIPESRELAAQYLLLYEMSLPYGNDLNNQINVDKSATRLTVLTDNVDSSELNMMRKSYEKWLRDNAPEAMWAEATSDSVMFASIAENTIKSLVISVPFALILVSLTLLIAFRSLKFGLLSMIPNLTPLIMAYGMWGMMVGRINFGLACVAGLSIGIVVDDTVHFMSKYLRGRREHGYSSEEAVLYAFDSVGRAMIITSVVLVCGFMVLAMSLFRFNSNMGMLAAITITFALLSDLLFLPPVLMLLDRKPSTASTKDS